MFDYIIKVGRQWFEHYEISNFTKPGMEESGIISCIGIMMSIMVWVLEPLVMLMVFVITNRAYPALSKGYS